MKNDIEKRIRQLTEDFIYQEIYALLITGRTKKKRQQLKILRQVIRKIEKTWSISAQVE